MGQYGQAIPVLEKAAPGFPLAMGALGNAWARVGRRDKALEVLQQLKRVSESRYVGPTSLFSVYVGLGDVDAAIEELTKAFDTHEGVVPIFTVDPAIDPVRDDARVKALLRRLGMPGTVRQSGAHR
jgi:tetratricopeptide (TPR) repeat protein